ncbi:MAG: DUF4304 domain-containing protein [Alphaproteobacteria bacterium]|nr:DUF4304 domain-containing protein [Alphaproteobacteria bacterium]
MDSKTVNKAIKEKIRPFLEKSGFSHFTERNSWRFSKTHTDIINFQSFNSYLAEGLDCTTYSFSVNLGCTHKAFPLFQHGKVKKRRDGTLLPEEYRCPFRLTLKRTIPQKKPGLLPLNYKRMDIWLIDPEGKYIEPAMNDVLNQIEKIALPWFENLRSEETIMHILQHQDEDMDTLWGFGNNPSPMRSYLLGYMALYLGQNQIARTYLQAVLDSVSFEDEKKYIREALEKLDG